MIERWEPTARWELAAERVIECRTSKFIADRLRWHPSIRNARNVIPAPATSAAIQSVVRAALPRASSVLRLECCGGRGHDFEAERILIGVASASYARLSCLPVSDEVRRWLDDFDRFLEGMS